MKRLLYILIVLLMPIVALAQNVGGEISRPQKQQSQPVRNPSRPTKPQQQIEAISYDSFSAALLSKAEAGDIDAQYSLGLIYENGLGIEKNMDKAIECYRIAAENGNANAQYHLGLCYENGNGIDKDIDLALDWYQKASAQGLEIAKIRFDTVFDNREELKDESHVVLQEINEDNSNRKTILQNIINNMVRVEGGTFMMGANKKQEKEAFSDEKPAHKVILSSFSIGKYEVTQEEWEAIMGQNPSVFKRPKQPIKGVSWDDCRKFLIRLNGLTGLHFRLPTEAEWEYAARGGKYSKGYKYSGSNDISEVAWYDGNSDDQAHVVGLKLPNELGLYDMSGNVSEWCQDRYSPDYYISSPTENPSGPSYGSSRVPRGGGYISKSKGCRTSCRDHHPASSAYVYYGFRLAL